MAWQAGAGAGGGGAMQQGDSGVQAYTLQGVMRFLQTEWHRHERDRNAWEIEREEMKKRIAGLEGEIRTSKGVRTSLEKHVKILEIALKKERERTKSLSNGQTVDLQKDPKEAAKDELKAVGNSIPVKGITTFDEELDPDSNLSQDVQQEKERDKSKSYLVKCSSEITYHVLPSSHIPPEVIDLPSNSIFQGHQPSQQELQDAYIQLQQQKQQQQYRDEMAMVRENAMPNQQQRLQQEEPQPLSRTATAINHNVPIRDIERKELDRSPQPMTAIDLRKQQLFQDQPPLPDEQVESVSHTYDAYGRQLQTSNEIDRNVEEAKIDMSDNWDFDEGPPRLDQPDVLQSHRPDMELFPSASQMPSKSPPRAPGSRRKSSGARRRSEGNNELTSLNTKAGMDNTQFKVRFAMRGHLDVVRCVIFTGGGSPSEPEFCTGSDDGGVKRWHIPGSYAHNSVAISEDLDRTAHFTHRGHIGAVCSLAACSGSPNFSNGGRVAGDGWIFSGGEDTSVRVWERGRVDSKAVLEGHKDAVWALCVLPGTAGSILGERCSQFGGPDRVLLAAGAADGTILIWAVSQPPQLSSPHAGSNRGARGSRRANSISAGSNFPSSPQPSVATNTPFHYSLVHRIERSGNPSPTSISPLSPNGESFVVSYTDASVLVFDTRTGEEIVGMASLETYDGTPNTSVNCVVASASGFDTTVSVTPSRRGSIGEHEGGHEHAGATGGDGSVEGVVIAGSEDRYVRFFDANSGQCTYTMLAHPSAISSLSLSPDGRELVSGGHDASLRFWNLEKRSCIQEVTHHRVMRGEGICCVTWSPDARWVVSAGGDGKVQVYSRG